MKLMVYSHFYAYVAGVNANACLNCYFKVIFTFIFYSFIDDLRLHFLIATIDIKLHVLICFNKTSLKLYLIHYAGLS